MEYKFLNTIEAEEIYNSYIKSDFPPEEVKPFKTILKLMNEGNYKVITFYEDSLIAYMFIFVNDTERTVFIDYYAVLKDKRQQGYGQKVILKLREIFDNMNYIFLESENIDFAKNDEDKNVRTKRIAFYTTKCALTDTGVRAKIFGVDYVVLCLVINEKPSKEQVHNEMVNVYNHFVTPEYRQKNVYIN